MRKFQTDKPFEFNRIGKHSRNQEEHQKIKDKLKRKRNKLSAMSRKRNK